MSFRETQNQWHVFIQDAILEKCNEKDAAIVHISVDKASNEVGRGTSFNPPPSPPYQATMVWKLNNYITLLFYTNNDCCACNNGKNIFSIIFQNIFSMYHLFYVTPKRYLFCRVSKLLFFCKILFKISQSEIIYLTSMTNQSELYADLSGASWDPE